MITTQNKDLLLIDFGSQYTQVIWRQLQKYELKIEIISSKNKDLFLQIHKFKSIIFSGGPNSVHQKNFLKIDSRIYDLKIPILGICYGMQLIHKELGGKVETKKYSEFGKSTLFIKDKKHLLLKGVPEKSQIWNSHSDSVVILANGFKTIACTEICSSITANDEKNIYTLQFHPELKNSIYGEQILKNFLFKISKLPKILKPDNEMEKKIKFIKNKVQSKNVLFALSGGVDSSVLAELLLVSLENKQIFPVFIDNGLLREKDKNKTISFYKKKFINFKFLDKSEIFLFNLKKIKDSEKKRKIIGDLFIDIFDKYIKKNNLNAKFLAQGTIFSDLIETGTTSENSQTIKSHHNVIALDKKHNFELLEPLSNLFKNDVKKLGKKLNVPDWILEQQPFPGPGMSIRICGEINKKKLRILRQVDEIFLSKLTEYKYDEYYKQAFGILLSSKSVGVKGDVRIKGYTAVLRAVKSENFMEAEVCEIPINILKKISNEILNNVKEISRVLYDLTNKPPGTIEWE